MASNWRGDSRLRSRGTHDVELLVNEPFDAIVASERLGFDLVAFPQVPMAHGTRAFLEVSAHYDLMVNTSFANTFASRAPRNVYYVHFPMPNGKVSALTRATWPVTAINPLARWIEREHGFWLGEFPGNGSWTKGDAVIDLVVPRGVTMPFGLSLSAKPWPIDRTPYVRVTVGTETVYDGVVPHRGRASARTVVTGRGVDDPIPVRIESDTFVPRIASGIPDDRELGVVVSHVYLGRRLPSVRPRDVVVLTSVVPGAFVDEFLESYQVVAANSAYTAAGWKICGGGQPPCSHRRWASGHRVRSDRSSSRSGASSPTCPVTRRSSWSWSRRSDWRARQASRGGSSISSVAAAPPSAATSRRCAAPRSVSRSASM